MPYNQRGNSARRHSYPSFPSYSGHNIFITKIQQGFTLIEIIIGMVVFSISLSIIFSLIGPAERNSADQIHQIKASELAQSLMDDIMSRAFDENSDKAGGRLRCDEDHDGDGDIEGTELCSNTMGTESENYRSDFDDVDDFDDFTLLVKATDSDNTNADDLHAGYNSFTVNVSVSYAGTDLGLVNNRLAKRIYITVTTPLGTAIEFSTYKANF